MARKFLVDVDVQGDIIVSGNVDGRDIALDGTNQDDHLLDETIHNKVLYQASQPTVWERGDVWIPT